MRSAITIISLALAASAAALPSSTHVLHEKRSSSSSWTKLHEVKLDERIILPVRIGLAETNLDSGYEMLMDIAHPRSPNYGKHWSVEQVYFG